MRATHVCLLLSLVAYLSAQYLPKTSKNVMFMNLCAGSKNPETCIPLHFSYDLLKTFEADCADLAWGGKCRATVAVSTVDGAVAIFFKGPPSMSSFASSSVSKLTAMTLTPFGTEFGSVGKDYATAFDRLWNGQGLGVYMQDVWSRYCDFVLLVSGHSLGSCLAQMAAVQLKSENLWIPSTIIYYGYGTPRCGDMDFAATMDAAATTRFRVNWLTDNAPQYPASTCAKTANAVYGSGNKCWFHCCNSYWLKSVSWLGFETWVDCKLSEEAKCIGGSATKDHTAYWYTSTNQYDSLSCGTSMTFKPDL